MGVSLEERERVSQPDPDPFDQSVPEIARQVGDECHKEEESMEEESREKK